MPHRDGNSAPRRWPGTCMSSATRPLDAGEPRACQPEPLRCPADGAGLASAFRSLSSASRVLRPGCGGPPAALRLGDPGRAGVCVRGAPPTPELGERNNKELIYPAGPLPCLGSSRTFSEGQRCFLGRNAGALSVCLEAAPRIRARLLRLRTLRRQMQTPRPAAPRRPKLPARDPTRDQRKHGATGLCVPQRAEATNGSPAEPAGARAAARPTRPEQGAHAGAHSHEAGKKRAGRPALPGRMQCIAVVGREGHPRPGNKETKGGCIKI